MQVQKQEVKELREEIGRSLESVEKGQSPSLEEAVSLLKQPASDEELAFRIWKYADKEKVPNHFRDFNYEDHNDLIESLEEIDKTSPQRYHRHELQAVKRTVDEIYDTF